MFVVLSGILAIVSAGLFAVQTDDDRTGYRVTRGISFYLQILLIALSIGLFVLALYDVFNARKTGGDPTEGIDHTQTTAATTYNNPGFREGRTNGNKIEFIDHSIKLITFSYPFRCLNDRFFRKTI